MEDIRIAAVIANAPLGRVDRNLERTGAWVRRAREGGAELICFPELHLTGYAADDGIRKSAQTIPGPLTQRLSEMAAASGMTILAGMAELDGDDIYAAHVVAGPDGRLQRYRKTHIAPPEQSIFTPGNEIPVFHTPKLTFGIQLCYDAHFPGISTHMALQGAEAIFMPHASPRGEAEDKRQSWSRHLTARAYDNAVFVVACNQSGANGAGLSFPGLALAYGPDGRILAERTTEGEDLLIVDLPADRLAHVRGHRMRYFFPNRRPDLYPPG